MANYSGIKITNAGTVAVSIKSASGGATEVSQMTATNHTFIHIIIDDANDIMTGIKADGSEYMYESHATLTITLMA